MLAWLSGLNAELIAGGFIGFAMLGVIIRNVILGWAEARLKVKETGNVVSPMVTAMSVSWDRDQIERALQLLESIAENLEIQSKHSESIAKAQSILSDSFQQSTQSKLNDLLDKIDHLPPNKRR